jgi:hypothetical protein
MNEDDRIHTAGPESGDPELLQYDFFKHMTSLVLITLGGMLILVKDFDPGDIKPVFVLAAVVLIGSSGAMAYSGSSEIVRARSTGTPTKRSLRIYARVAPLVLAVGLGIFLAMFLDSLN